MATELDSPTLGRGDDWGAFLVQSPLEANDPFSPSAFGLLLFSVPDANAALDLLGAAPGHGALTFADIGGTISIDQFPPGSVATLESIGEDALYFYDNDTALPSLSSALETAAFLSGSLAFSDLSGTISIDQFPAGSVATLDAIGESGFYFFDDAAFTPELLGRADTVAFLNLQFTDLGGTVSIDQFPPGSVASLDSIGESGFYFFDDALFVPELIGKDDTLAFLLPDQTGNDGFFLQTNAGVLSWAAASGGSSAWGDLTGTLSDQLDLQAALDAKQALDSDLTTIAGLTATTDNFIVSVSSAWASRTPAQVRTTLGLVIGTNVQAWDADLDTWAGKTPYAGSLVITTAKTATISNTLTLTATDGSTLAIGTGGTLGTAAYTASSAYQPIDSDLTTIAGLTATTDNFIVSVASAWASRTPAQVKTTLGLVIGTNVQAWDADLDAVAALTTDSFGLALLTKTSAANIRTYIGCGTSSFDGAFSSLTGTPTTLSGYGITDAQPLDSDLTTIAGLTATTDNFIISVASAWASRTPAQARTTLGLVIGTNVQAWDADLDTIAGLTATTDNFIVSVSSAWASRTPAQVLSTLAAVGTTFQPLDSDLTTIAGLTATTDNFIVSVSSAWASRTPAQVLSTLAAVGTTFQPLDSDLTTIAGLTATTDNFIVSVASAWASRTPTQVKSTLGLVIGTNVQAWDADLDTIAGLTATTDNFMVSVSSAWASRTPSQVRTTLALVIGTNVQAWDADLDSWAAITRASGFDTFTTTPSSANLRSLLTDENGTGAALFSGATTPDFTTGFTIGTAATSRKIMVGNGTNFVPSTETWATPGTDGTVLTSDGTNWVAREVGAWDGITSVVTTDFTTSSTTLADITGLVTGTLANSTLYEVIVTGFALSSTAAGMGMAWHGGGGGTAATIWANGAYGAALVTTVAIDTASTVGTGANKQAFYLQGYFTTRSTGTATISLQVSKITSGTGTIFVGTTLKWRAV